MAVIKNKPKLLFSMLAGNLNLELKNNEGLTAIELSKKNNNTTCNEILSDYQNGKTLNLNNLFYLPPSFKSRMFLILLCWKQYSRTTSFAFPKYIFVDIINYSIFYK